MQSISVSLILLAAGSGTRMAGVVPDKLLAPLLGIPVFARSVINCTANQLFDSVVVVFRNKEQQKALAALWDAYAPEDLPVTWVKGGRSRADSVRNALNKLPEDSEVVLVHDAARPLVANEAVRAVIVSAHRHGAAVLAHRATDTIKRVPSASSSKPQFLEDLDRSKLWAMETPQGFHVSRLLAGYASARTKLTDDAAAVSFLGYKVYMVENFAPNPKITQPQDLAWAEFLLAYNE
ncbi:MAG: 2-C-methyl-D-erythritol 4-phosphate cytidylyltransferase [Verrucomicrobia bacterium]|nr:2-C-methyl-D-erythritol 4-phosphate cytidylyltransferase [Verrucomicrobiota bacterium]